MMKFGSKIIKLSIVTLFSMGSYAMADFGKKDLPEMISEGFSINSNMNSIKNIRVSDKYKDKSFSMTGKISGYYNGHEKNNTHSILWVKGSKDIRVGCLANENDTKFDNFEIGQTVTMKGKIRYISTEKKNLVLKRGCTVTSN